MKRLCLAIVGCLALVGCGEDDLVTLDVAEGCNPLASTADACLFPLPSRFFERPDETATGIRWSYRDDQLELDGYSPIRFDRFNLADGASPMMPILVHLGLDVDPAQLVDQRDIARSLDAEAPIVLLDLVTGEHLPVMTEMDQNLREPEHTGRHALIVRPMKPMAFGHRHAVVIRDSLRAADGSPVAAPAGFAALRDGVPTTHALLEEHRAAFDGLFSTLAGFGFARESLSLAWDFQVASEAHVLGSVLSMREQALALIDEEGHSYTITRVEADPNENTALIVEGDFDVPCFIDENNDVHRDESGAAILQGSCSFPFTMVVPAVAKAAGQLPLTLFGHGIFGEGRAYLTGGIGTNILQPLAQQGGSVVVATDWIGLSDSDFDIILSEVVPDLNRLPVITDRLQQSLINNLVLIDLALNALSTDPMIDLGQGPLILDGPVNYYGVSLGGIQGASLFALSRDIERAILAVPGSSWSTMLPRSVVYQPIKALVDPKYPDPLVQLAFVSFLQGMFDFSDPINLSYLSYDAPLPDAPSERHVVLQEAVGDCQVPNLVTRILAHRIGAKQLSPLAEPAFGVEPVSAPAQGAVLAQFVMPERLADYTPPDEPIVPEKDNGVHSDAIVLPAAVAQVLDLLATGQITHPCDGVCDPD
jgi:hypothetical protein